MATPNYAAPDEPVHAYRAASLVRGQLLGTDVSVPGDPSVRVSVPATLTAYRPKCFAFKPAVSASCMPAWTARPGMSDTNTYTGRYPPLYYLAVGLPSLVNTGGSMLLWMRLAGDVVNAMLLTVGFVMLARVRRSSWAVFGGAAALTPMVLFISSVVNPSGLEICAAIALWCTLLAWFRADAGKPERSTVAWAIVAAVTFESTRGLSPVFMLMTVLAVGAVAGWSRCRDLLRQQELRLFATIAATFGLLAVGWVVVAGSLRLIRTSPVPPDVSTLGVVRAALFKNRQFSPFVGNFGWLDTPAPVWVVDVWKVAAVVLVVGVLASRAWRSLLVVAMVLVATLLIPTVGDLLEARTIGLVSQARYILPLAVGASLVAGAGITVGGRFARPAAHVGMAFLAVAQVGAFLRALLRYRSGLGGSAPIAQPQWSPPLGAPVVVGIFVVSMAGLQWWLWTLTRHGRLPGTVRRDDAVRRSAVPAAGEA